MSEVARYAAVWLAQIRYSMVRERMFKVTFLLWIVVDLCWFALNLCFVQFLYLQVNTVAGWNQWEMVLLVSTNYLVQQIFQTFLMINLTKLPDLIRSGGLDFLLAQPASVQFIISTRRFELGSVFTSVMAVVVCGIAIGHLHTNLSHVGLVVFPFLVMCGVMIHYAMLLMLMSLAFWMTRAQGFIYAYYNFFQISRLPREAFHGVTRLIFTWGIPLLLIANVPARTLLYRPDWGDLAGMLGATVVLLVLSTAVFRAGLRRYGSASS